MFKPFVRITVFATVALGAFAGGVMANSSGRNYDLRAGDRAFVNDAGVICTDQLLTALKSTRPLARTLGRYGLVCIPNSGSLYSTYTVRLSELGVIVQRGDRTVFVGRN